MRKLWSDLRAEIIFLALGIIALLITGCGGAAGNSVVRVTVDSATHLSRVSSFSVEVTNNGIMSQPITVPLSVAGVDIPPAKNFPLVFEPGKTGAVRVVVAAMSTGQTILSMGEGEGEIVAGGESAVMVMLGENGKRPVVDMGEAPKPDMVINPDMSPLPCTRGGASGVGIVQGEQVYCDGTYDGGGWVLVYSNSNNWADVNASDIVPIQANGHTVFKWFDSDWKLNRVKDNTWLGKPWNGTNPFMPDQIGSNNLKRFYDTGYTQIRFEFIQGSPFETANGWCDTTGEGWDWRAENVKTFRCKKGGGMGSGEMLCLAGMTTSCDTVTWNSGWIHGIALGNQKWDYAYQSAPNHLSVDSDHGGALTDAAVISWNVSEHNNNAMNGNYQTRLWLRKPN